MKRIFAVILIISMCLGLFMGCKGNDDISLDDDTIRIAILDEFLKLSQIPRESGHVRAVSNYLKVWATENDFKAVRDKYNNIIINKPASNGYENSPTTILQCHMDMITVVEEGVIFNPLYDSIKVVNDGEILVAEGTNLGADNGLGVATALYILKNAEKHGPIRVIITVDGETTRLGAEKLDSKYLKGDYLINLDWESHRSIGNGSAGTTSFVISRDITWVKPKNTVAYDLSISGLTGGDSGKNINDGGANAIKIIGETLAKMQGAGILFELASFNGGITKNTIPTDAIVLVIINDSDIKKFNSIFNSSLNVFKDTYGSIEKNYSFTYTEAVMPKKVLSTEDSTRIVSFLYGIVNGVQSKSSKNIVESSSNIGTVSTKTGDFISEVYTRSSSEEMAQKITGEHEAISTICDLKYRFKVSSPGWSTNPDGLLIPTLSDIYFNIYNEKMSIETVHIEHECGWFAFKNPDLEIASIGNLIHNPNSTEETITLKSITKPATVILTFLEQTR